MIMFLADSMLSLEPRKMILVSYAWEYDVCDESEEDREDVQVDHLGLWLWTMDVIWGRWRIFPNWPQDGEYFKVDHLGLWLHLHFAPAGPADGFHLQ